VAVRSRLLVEPESSNTCHCATLAFRNPSIVLHKITPADAATEIQRNHMQSQEHCGIRIESPVVMADPDPGFGDCHAVPVLDFSEGNGV
jgi:hypothetical protein